MKMTALKISDVKLIETEIFEDDRGLFFESFNQEKFNKAIGHSVSFVQDNQSTSKTHKSHVDQFLAPKTPHVDTPNRTKNDQKNNTKKNQQKI